MVWLNAGVRVYTRFKPLAARRTPHRTLLPVAALAVLGIAGVWWMLSHRESGQAGAKPIASDGRVSRVGATDNHAGSGANHPPVHKPAASLPVSEAVAVPDPILITNNMEPRNGETYPRPVRNLFEAQVALACLAISPGSLDAAKGSRTRAALIAFQRRKGLPESGQLDTLTRSRLMLVSPSLTNHVVTTNELLRLRPLGQTWIEKSQQEVMEYETILELVSELSWSTPSMIRSLNPGVNWTNVQPGDVVSVPNVSRQAPSERAAFARIGLDERYLAVFDGGSNLVAHFPCSVAKFADKRPLGELHVAVLAPNPNYTFDPENFPESAEARRIDRKLVLQPGPNNPVGTVWIGLDRPGYGIHGTPLPDQVGRAESHGCFRLANWNAEYLLQLAWVGMPVFVEP